MALSRVVSAIVHFEKYRDLEIWVNGHSITSTKAVIVFISVCFSVCLFVCLFVTGLRINYSIDFLKILRKGGTCAMEQTVRFSW